MDFTFSDAMKAGGASTVLIVAVGLAYKLIQMACNHRIKSDCCGRQGTIGVEVEVWNGTPPDRLRQQSPSYAGMPDPNPKKEAFTSSEVKVEVA